MPLIKSGVTVNFSQGLDQKTDPNQLALGKFTSLTNTVFDTLGQLKKRNGFGPLATTIGSTSFLTTYDGDLIALGNNLQIYSPQVSSFLETTSFTPVQLSTVPLVNNMYSQSNVDTALADNGLLCVTYTQGSLDPGGKFKYVICNPATGQNIIQPRSVSLGSQHFSSRVFYSNNYFVILYDQSNQTNSTSSLTALFIPSTNPQSVGSVSTLTTMSSNPTMGFDATVASSSIYVAWNAPASGGITAGLINPSRVFSSVGVVSSVSARTVSVAADVSTSPATIWSVFSDPGSSSINYVAASAATLAPIFSTQTISSGSAVVNQSTLTALNGKMTAYSEMNKVYAYDTNISTNHIYKFSVLNSGQVVSSMSVISRCTGLASKAFLTNSTSYFLSVYNSTYQSTYFLMNSTGGIKARLAYGNAGGYLTTGLPSVNVTASSSSVAYLNQNFITTVNKVTNTSAPIQTAGIYSQTGIKYASLAFTSSGLVTKELGGCLQLNGGFLGQYDGGQFVENNFFVYPDYIEAFAAASGGSIAAGTYYYQAVYEWVDSKGSRYNSAPSIPVSVVATTSSTAITVNIPTPRLTLKTTDNPIKVGIYRWSTAQQTYFKISPSIVMNQGALVSDYFTVQDTVADSSIVGNEILYTNGGVVVEDTNGPAFKTMTIFDNRLFGIAAEDTNQLWYSKTLLEETPVEMSDFFTLFVPPSVGAEGPTGDLQCIFPMDDKLIEFKKNAIYYMNGTGPDDSGNNSQYSQSIFITSAVGCANQNSIVLIPNGLMFQSSKGIWLLGRDLSTSYIGKDVEAFNSSIVTSAIVAPGTNQVRLSLNTGEVLLYDYFVGQWGEFTGISNVSGTVYNNLQTVVGSNGQVLQETPGAYLDNTTPTVMSFTTGWIDLAGLQGYERLYRAYMLANYKSPHTFTIGVAYNYDPTITQTITVTPDPTDTVEQWQLNFVNQQCQSFQLTFTESYDPSVGPAAGAGLTISGLNLVIGGKSTFTQNIPASQRKS